VPGETITITVPKRNLSGSFLVTDVATDNEPGGALDDVSPSDENNLIRTVTCASNIHEQEHQTLTRWWSEKDTNGIATPTGSGAVPGPPPYSVQWNDSTSGRALFGGAYHVLYYDLFWDQPDIFTSPPEVRTKGLLFLTNQHLGADGHIGITDPQRLEMGMLGDGDFSMDLFSLEEGSPPQQIPATILINSTGNIILTAGTPVSDLNWGAIALVGAQNIDKTISIVGPGGPEPGVSTLPGVFGQSFARFNDHNVLDSISGQYRTVSTLPFSIQVTGNETDNEFLVYVVTAGTGTIFLPWIGTAGVPNYRSFPVTLVGRQYYIVNDGGGTLTVDAGTAGTNINDATTITLADKAAVHVERHDDGWRILGSFGTVTGGGASSGATPGGTDKDVQFNDGGAFGGEDAFEYDKTKDQLRLIRTVDDTQLRLSSFGVDSGMIGLWASDDENNIQFGWERIAGPSTLVHAYAPGTIYWTNVGGSGISPGNDRIAIEINPGEDPGSPATFALGRGIDISADGVASVYQYGGLGVGEEGCQLYIQRNTTGDGASAAVGMENLDGTPYYLWHDEFHIPRWFTDPPGEGGSPSGDTDGYRLSPMQVVVKSGDESVANDTLQNDDELFFAVGTNEVWIFEMVLFVNSGTSNTPDIKWDFTIPASATIKYGAQSMSTGATGVNGVQFMFGVETATVLGSGAAITTATIETMPIYLNGTVRTAGTAGTVQFRWAQNVTTGGSPTVVRIDSYLKAYLYSKT
jgi:hypothetical protein